MEFVSYSENYDNVHQVQCGTTEGHWMGSQVAGELCDKHFPVNTGYSQLVCTRPFKVMFIRETMLVVQFLGLANWNEHHSAVGLGEKYPQVHCSHTYRCTVAICMLHKYHLPNHTYQLDQGLQRRLTFLTQEFVSLHHRSVITVM